MSAIPPVSKIAVLNRMYRHAAQAEQSNGHSEEQYNVSNEADRSERSCRLVGLKDARKIRMCTAGGRSTLLVSSGKVRSEGDPRS